MTEYPEAVTKIVEDYLERLRSQLSLVPAREQNELVREIQSHVYEAYQEAPSDDDVARVLAVLRKLGEPSEVVSDRLPEAMVRSGTRRSLPLYILGGILIALFGVPLGFGGVAVLLGVLVALAGVVIAYYAAAGTILLAGVVVMLLGLTRIYQPGAWDKLVTAGFIHMDGGLADLLDLLTPSGQGLVLIAVAGMFAACGMGMLWLGRYLVRGLRFLLSLGFNWIRQLAHAAPRLLGKAEQKATDPTRVLWNAQ